MQETIIEKPKHFVGRQGVIRRIFSRIGAERPQSIALIGGSKIGKSALLDRLLVPAVRAEYLDEEFAFAHLNCGEVSSPSELLSRIANHLSRDRDPAEISYDIFRALMEGVVESGVKIILLLDDFHLVTGSSEFPLEFFSFLRSIANNFNVAYVTSSSLELQQLCAIKDVEESPFFNIFTNITLNPLTFDEGTELLVALTEWQESTARAVVEWAGGVPYVIERIASTIRTQPSTRDRDLAAIIGPVLSAYFAGAISMLPREAYAPLRRVAKQRPVSPREWHYVQYLVKQGFLRQDGKKLLPFAPAFGHYLKSELKEEHLGDL